MSPLIDKSGNQRMMKLTLLSPINARLSKHFSVPQIIRSENNQQSTDENVGRDASVVNQPIPLPLNDDIYVSGRNGVSASESEVLEVSGVSGKCRAWLARKWWSGCKYADLIQPILAIWYQVLHNLYIVLGL